MLWSYVRSPSACCLGIAVLALGGCTVLGTSHEDDGGHKGRVVDAYTGRGLNGAKLSGMLPSYSDRVVKAKGNGRFCYHFRGEPGGIVFSYPGYESRTYVTAAFLRTQLFELIPMEKSKPRSPLLGGDKEDLLTPFERKILKENR